MSIDQTKADYKTTPKTATMTTQKTALLAITQNGKALAKDIKAKLGYGDIYVTVKLSEAGTFQITPTLKELTGKLFKQYEVLIFIMATGITVRMIAPYLEDKLKDPAVLVVDELGQNVISLLSGHMGGGNEMTQKVSQLLNAHPVITTSTDVNGKTALDTIAKTLDAFIDNFKETVKDINYRLVHNKKIGLYQEFDYKIDTNGFTILESLDEKKSIDNIKSIDNSKSIEHIKIIEDAQNLQDIKGLQGSKKLGDANSLDSFEKIVCITYKKDLPLQTSQVVKVIPRDLIVGIGCRKDTPKQLLTESFNHFLETHNIDIHAIKSLASIEVKENEEAIVALADTLNVPFQIVNRQEIVKVEHLFEKSEFVKKSIGIYNVAEPVAYLLSGGHLWIKKHKYRGITFAIGRIQR